MPQDKHLQPGVTTKVVRSDTSLADERARINAETARIAWRELQRFFAQGHAIFIAPDLDLIDVALQMQQDNRPVIENWLASARLAPVTDTQALDWFEHDATLWCVVVKPWVLVQPDAATPPGSIS